jgi:hypothetical protein
MLHYLQLDNNLSGFRESRLIQPASPNHERAVAHPDPSASPAGGSERRAAHSWVRWVQLPRGSTDEIVREHRRRCLTGCASDAILRAIPPGAV